MVYSWIIGHPVLATSTRIVRTAALSAAWWLFPEHSPVRLRSPHVVLAYVISIAIDGDASDPRCGCGRRALREHSAHPLTEFAHDKPRPRRRLRLRQGPATRLAAFYAAVLGMRQVHATDEMAILASPDLQLLVHRIPAHIAAGHPHRDAAAVRREDCRLSSSSPPCRASPMPAHGRRFAGGRNCSTSAGQGPGFIVCNATDPEGNIFQVREEK